MRSAPRRHFPAVAVTAVVLAATSPAAALARSGGGEVRAAGTCGGTATAKLKLKSDDGFIEAEFEAEHLRRHSRWRVTVVQERRVVWRARRRARAGRLEMRRSLTDLSGADRISVRATSRDGVICSAAATLPG